MAATLTFQGLVTNGAQYTTGAGSGQDDFTASEIVADFNIVLTANYGTASSHGDPISFAVAMPISIGNQAPSRWVIDELVVAGAAPYGFKYNYAPGPTLAAPTQNGGVLQIVGSGAGSGQGGTELTQASAYASQTPSLNNAVLRARFWFAKL